MPGVHEEEDAATDRERHPAAIRDLDDIGAKEREVDREKRPCQRAGPQRRPVPALARDDVEQHRRDCHRSRHGDAVRGTERARRLEAEDEQQAADHQGCIHARNVDLADLRSRRMNDRDARPVVELHALLCQREGGGDESLRSHDGRERRDHDERIQEGARCQEVERVLDGVGDAQHQRTLAEIVEE